jgi:hypothetical protein
MSLVREYGVFWARNPKNIAKLRTVSKTSTGVYILFSGSAPVYIGKGYIRKRVRKRDGRSSKGLCWDHLSWFTHNNSKVEHDMEARLLKTLPFYLRSLNKQSAHFLDATKHVDKNPETHLRLPKFISSRQR